MIYDGVLERFPQLRVGIIELGANWVPASLMNLDMGVSLLGKFDKNLKSLSLKPSRVFSASDSGGTSAYRKYWMDFT